MEKVIKTMKSILSLSVGIFVVLACDTSINESVHVSDGKTHDGNINVVNGQIVIGNNCLIKGNCRVVNGSVTMGNNSTAYSITAINGGTNIGEDCRINDEITSVNGSINIKQRSETGEISTVNGNIDIRGTHVTGDVNIINGDITLSDSAVVKGNIIIKSGDDNEKRRVEIWLKNRSVVNGGIHAKNDNVDVRIYISGEGKVLGDIDEAEIIYQ